VEVRNYKDNFFERKIWMNGFVEWLNLGRGNRGSKRGMGGGGGVYDYLVGGVLIAKGGRGWEDQELFNDKKIVKHW